MRHLLVILLLSQTAALACLPPYQSPAMMSAERTLSALGVGEPCPPVVDDTCQRTYRAGPQEVARLFAQQQNTVARRSGAVWTVVLDEYRGQQVQIRAVAEGAKVLQSNRETAYETLLSRLVEAVDRAGHSAQPVTCAQLGLASDPVLGFRQCRVSWEKLRFPLPGQVEQAVIHFTLDRSADRTAEVGRAFVYSPLMPGDYPCASPLNYD
ncbi:hypothetical protein GO986_03420 [Deinococcus sp. HMF7620]|uniref:Uncharacterized protein n=1 Tax=Deinococcus arboris TaxID=2682977 RepID=A0A7C9HWD4_9DEIO|nr:hypothetical protein [Deinococcus arboris]MVN85810.1 hypothetical protein [Deinococcus arboris]